METLGHIKLREYMRKTGLGTSQLASLTGLAGPQISHLTSGRRRASLAVAVQLAKVTRGAVAVDAWVKTTEEGGNTHGSEDIQEEVEKDAHQNGRKAAPRCPTGAPGKRARRKGCACS